MLFTNQQCSESIHLPFCEIALRPYCCSKLWQLALQKRGLETGAVTAGKEGMNWCDHLAAKPQACLPLS